MWREGMAQWFSFGVNAFPEYDPGWVKLAIRYITSKGLETC